MPQPLCRRWEYIYMCVLAYASVVSYNIIYRFNINSRKIGGSYRIWIQYLNERCKYAHLTGQYNGTIQTDDPFQHHRYMTYIMSRLYFVTDVYNMSTLRDIPNGPFSTCAY